MVLTAIVAVLSAVGSVQWVWAPTFLSTFIASFYILNQYMNIHVCMIAFLDVCACAENPALL